jgi:hypothetical protein
MRYIAALIYALLISSFLDACKLHVGLPYSHAVQWKLIHSSIGSEQNEPPSLTQQGSCTESTHSVNLVNSLANCSQCLSIPVYPRSQCL